jgi:hypothetical protein
VIEHVLFKIIIKKKQSCPFESFKRIIYGLIWIIIYVDIEPPYCAFTCDFQITQKITMLCKNLGSRNKRYNKCMKIL